MPPNQPNFLEEAKQIQQNPLSFLQTSKEEKKTESDPQYPSLDGFVTPNNPDLMLKVNKNHEVSNSNENQQSNKNSHTQKETFGGENFLQQQRELQEAKNDANEGLERQSATAGNTQANAAQEFKQPPQKLDRNQEDRAIDSLEDDDSELNFKDLEHQRNDIPLGNSALGASRDIVRGHPVVIDQEALIPVEEKFTMFKCPRDKTLNEMGQPCAKCNHDIEYYEIKGCQFETMICEVSQSDLLKQFEDQHVNANRQEKPYSQNKDYSNKLDEEEQKQPLAYWICFICKYTNNFASVGKVCPQCHKNTFYKSQQTEKPPKNEVVNKTDPKTQNLPNPDYCPWTCKKCNKRSYFLSSRCLICKISKQEQDQKEQQAKMCAQCGQEKESINSTLCKECTQTVERQKQMKCIQCKTQEKYKIYDYCKSCRLTQLNEEFEQEQKRKQEELEAQQQLRKQQLEQIKLERQKKCKNCDRIKASPSDAYCLHCICTYCSKEIILKGYDRCYDCLQKKSEEDRVRLNQRIAEETAQRQRKAEENQKRQEAEQKAKQEAEIKRQQQLKEEQERQAKELEEKRKLSQTAAQQANQAQQPNCANCRKPYTKKQAEGVYCFSCICVKCNQRVIHKESDECYQCKLETEVKNAKERQQDEHKKAEKTRQDQHKLQALEQQKQAAEKAAKELLCFVCNKQKQNREQIVCTSCENKQAQQKRLDTSQLCSQCQSRPAISQVTGAMCQECKDKQLSKYFCPDCYGKKETIVQAKCNACGGKQQQNQRQASNFCILCNRYLLTGENVFCEDCFKKQPPSKCKMCHENRPEHNSDFCGSCQFKSFKNSMRKQCSRCEVDIYSTEAGNELCNKCRYLCKCERGQVEEGKRRCFDCRSEASSAKEKPDKQRPQTSNLNNSARSYLNSSQASQKDQKIIKCPKCNKNMDLKTVTAGLKKILKCKACGQGVKMEEICSHNKIYDLNQFGVPIF